MAWNMTAIGQALPRLMPVMQMHAMPAHESQLCSIVENSSLHLAALRAVRSLNAPEAAIGAGFIRAAVWDHLSACPPTTVDDVDVLYFDRADASWDAETALEKALMKQLPGLPWSVRNQARMHERNGDPQYSSVGHAMQHWLETPTCVALRLEADNTMTVIAPYGLDDLFARVIRPTPAGKRRASAYRERIASKAWHLRWPGIRVIMP